MVDKITSLFEVTGKLLTDLLQEGIKNFTEKASVPEPKSASSSLDLSVNKVYRTKSGKIVEILRGLQLTDLTERAVHVYIFAGSDNKYYNSDGSVVDNTSGDKSDPIVSEADEPFAQKISLEVGKTYLTRDRRRVTIVEDISDEVKSWFMSDGGAVYYPDGTAPEEGTDQADIVSEADLEEIEAVENFRIEVGKLYETESGQHVTIQSKHHAMGFSHPVLVGSNRSLYTEQGAVFVMGDVRRPDNIKREVPVEPEPMLDDDLISRTKVLNFLKSFVEGGHCGESTSDKLDRQRENAIVGKITEGLAKLK